MSMVNVEIEKILSLEDVEAPRDQLRSEEQAIDQGIQRANQAEAQAKKEIGDIEANVLPGLLVEQFFGKKTLKAKIDKTKERRAELSETVKDLPLLLKGLEDKHVRVHSLGGLIEKRERHIQQDLKKAQPPEK